MEVSSLLREGDPLGHRLEVVDGFRGLHLHHAGQPATTLGRMEDQVGIPRRRTGPNGSDLLLPGIDRDVVLPLVLRLQQANHPIMLELLAHRPHEDGAHKTSESRGVAGGRENTAGIRPIARKI